MPGLAVRPFGVQPGDLDVEFEPATGRRWPPPSWPGARWRRTAPRSDVSARVRCAVGARLGALVVGLPAVRPPRAELGLALRGLRRGVRGRSGARRSGARAVGGRSRRSRRGRVGAARRYRPRRPTGDDLRRWHDRPPSDAEIVAALGGARRRGAGRAALRDRGVARRGRPAGGCGGPVGVPGMRQRRSSCRSTSRASCSRSRGATRTSCSRTSPPWPARSTGASTTSSRCRRARRRRYLAMVE